MASLESVLVAGLVHLIFRCALYITPHIKLKAPCSPLSTIIVGVAVLDLIYDSRLVPLSMDRKPRIIKCICECLVAIFIMEVAMLIFWQTIEYTIFLTVNTFLLGLNIVSPDTYDRRESLLIGAFTLPLALATFVAVAKTTNRLNQLHRRYISQPTQVHLRLNNTVQFLRRSDRYKKIRFREALEKYNSANNAPERRSVWVKYFQNNM